MLTFVHHQRTLEQTQTEVKRVTAELEQLRKQQQPSQAIAEAALAAEQPAKKRGRKPKQEPTTQSQQTPVAAPSSESTPVANFVSPKSAASAEEKEAKELEEGEYDEAGGMDIDMPPLTQQSQEGTHEATTFRFPTATLHGFCVPFDGLTLFCSTRACAHGPRQAESSDLRA